MTSINNFTQPYKTTVFTDLENDLYNFFQQLNIVVPKDLPAETQQQITIFLKILQSMNLDLGYEPNELSKMLELFLALPDNDKRSAAIVAIRDELEATIFRTSIASNFINEQLTQDSINHILDKMPYQLRLAAMYYLATGEELTPELEELFESDIANQGKQVQELSLEDVKYIADTAPERYLGAEGLRLDKGEKDDSIPNTRPGFKLTGSIASQPVTKERLREILAQNKFMQNQTSNTNSQTLKAPVLPLVNAPQPQNSTLTGPLTARPTKPGFRPQTLQNSAPRPPQPQRPQKPEFPSPATRQTSQSSTQGDTLRPQAPNNALPTVPTPPTIRNRDAYRNLPGVVRPTNSK